MAGKKRRISPATTKTSDPDVTELVEKARGTNLLSEETPFLTSAPE